MAVLHHHPPVNPLVYRVPVPQVFREHPVWKNWDPLKSLTNADLQGLPALVLQALEARLPAVTGNHQLRLHQAMVQENRRLPGL